MSNYPTISVCMIVKNEEANLPRLLTSIQGLADEVVVVDTGSTDKTVEIAESFGAKVHHFEWCDDFSAARNESLKCATKDYVLWLDGDDEVEKSEHGTIRKHFKKHLGTAVFLRLRNIHAAEETKAVQLRAFPNHKGVRFQGRVHEQAFFSIQELGIRTTNCDATIIHHGYETEGGAVEKLRRNKKIQEKEILEDPDNPYIRFFLARTLKGLGEHEEALESYLSFVNMAQGKPALTEIDAYKIALYEAAEMFLSLGRVDDALAILEASRNLFPQFRLLNFLLGQLYFQLGNYERAYSELLPLRGYRFDNECLPLDVNRSNAVLQRCLGISALFTHDYETATTYLKKSVEMDPENGENYQYLSLAFEKSGDMEKAIDACEKGIEATGGDGFLAKRHFLLFVKKGDFATALEKLEGLNGRGADVDVLAAMFLIHSSRLNMVEITRYYDLIEQALSLPRESFPEGYPNVRDALALCGDPQATEFFDGAISGLLKN